MIYTILFLLIAAEAIALFVIDRNARKLDDELVKKHSELASMGKELIYYKAENERLEYELKKKNAPVVKKVYKKKKQENPAVVKK